MRRSISGRFPGHPKHKTLVGLTLARARPFAGRLALALTMASLVSACSAENNVISTGRGQRSSAASSPEAQAMKIRLTINGKATTATLMANPTARDFIAMLPMTLTLEDYASTEKIAYLPKKLSTQHSPAGVDPDAGDITYYAPWGNLAIFYRDFGYATGLIKLGRFDAGIEALDVPGSLKVTIETIAK